MDIRRRFLSKKSSGGSSGGDSSGTYTVNLNGQWEKTTAVTNPDSSLYDGVYRSKSNYNVHNTAAIMYIDISGLTSFKLYIRSYAESNYDYVMVSQLDQTIDNNTSYSNTSLVKAHTRGNQQSGTALSSYTLVEFTGIDGGSHRITVVYRKDGSSNSGDDRGYVLIPKSQGSGDSGGGGDVDIDTTYSIMYTSSDGNVVTPYRTTVFGANITNNVYVNGQGIITFDGPVTSFGRSAFSGRTSLMSITIPDSVTSIGDSAFENCTSLTSVTVGNSVTSLGSSAFHDCSNLKNVTLGNSITSIAGYTFYGCTSMTSVTLGKGVTYIGSDAFTNCGGELIIQSNIAGSSSAQSSPLSNSKFTKITFGDGATSIGSYLIYGNVFLTSITIGNSVTSIGYSAFDSCTSLASITIGNSVSSIGSSAFRDCASLRSITIPDSVTSIGDYAFNGCDNLTNITIGSGIEQIGMLAFECPNIDKLYCKALVPPKLYYSSSYPDNLSIKKV